MHYSDPAIRSEFVNFLELHQQQFKIDLDLQQLNGLSDYYELVRQHNALLHLVAPCSPEEFAIRHILESLTLPEFLPNGAKFVDVGTGAGLPSVPCLIVRKDLTATLIESKEKKAKFLELAIDELDLSKRAKVVNRQFEEIGADDTGFVTCRALDKFKDKLPKLVKWSKGRTLLFFGGPELGEKMRGLGLSVEEKLMPLSVQRFLFISKA